MKKTHIGFCFPSTPNFLQGIISAGQIGKSFGQNMPLQTFLQDPIWSKKSVINSDEEKKKIRTHLHREDQRLYIHASFTSYPWNGKGSTENRIKKLIREIHTAKEIGAAGIIVHTGEGSTEQVRGLLHRLAEVLLPKSDFILYFEIHSAARSEHTLETPEKIKSFFDAMRDDTSARDIDLSIGLCVDTAHLHSIGVSLCSYEEAEEWFNALPPVPLLVHLNDSAAVAGSGKDIHQLLCLGSIWSLYHPGSGCFSFNQSGLYYILQRSAAESVDCIIERSPAGTLADLHLLHQTKCFSL